MENTADSCFGLNLLWEEEIENAVVGAAMMEADSLKELMGFIRHDMFYKEDNRLIYEAVELLVQEDLCPDLLMVVEKLRQMGRLEEVGGPYNVTLKTYNLASSAHLWQHAHVVYEYYLRRSMVALMVGRAREAGDLTQDVFDVLDGVMRDFETLRTGSPVETHLLDMKGVMERTCERIRQRAAHGVNGVTGIPTGIPELDRMTGGWQPGNLIFTAGRPGIGKTQLGLKFAMEAARSGHRTLFYTLEMMTEEVGERVLLMRAPELLGKVRTGKGSAQEMEMLMDMARGMGECPLMVDDTPYVSIDRLCAGAKAVKARYGLDLVVVDYLQLVGVASKPGRNREQEVAECSRRLKALARTLECPVIVACQLNRQVEQTFDHRPELKHLRESGAIEQDADLVVMLYRSTRAGSTRRCELIVAKNRHGEVSGPTGSVEVELF